MTKDELSSILEYAKDYPGTLGVLADALAEEGDAGKIIFVLQQVMVFYSSIENLQLFSIACKMPEQSPLRRILLVIDRYFEDSDHNGKAEVRDLLLMEAYQFYDILGLSYQQVAILENWIGCFGFFMRRNSYTQRDVLRLRDRDGNVLMSWALFPDMQLRVKLPCGAMAAVVPTKRNNTYTHRVSEITFGGNPSVLVDGQTLQVEML